MGDKVDEAINNLMNKLHPEAAEAGTEKAVEAKTEDKIYGVQPSVTLANQPSVTLVALKQIAFSQWQALAKQSNTSKSIIEQGFHEQVHVDHIDDVMKEHHDDAVKVAAALFNEKWLNIPEAANALKTKYTDEEFSLNVLAVGWWVYTHLDEIVEAVGKLAEKPKPLVAAQIKAEIKKLKADQVKVPEGKDLEEELKAVKYFIEHQNAYLDNSAIISEVLHSFPWLSKVYKDEDILETIVAHRCYVCGACGMTIQGHSAFMQHKCDSAKPAEGETHQYDSFMQGFWSVFMAFKETFEDPIPEGFTITKMGDAEGWKLELNHTFAKKYALLEAHSMSLNAANHLLQENIKELETELTNHKKLLAAKEAAVAQQTVAHDLAQKMGLTKYDGLVSLKEYIDDIVEAKVELNMDKVLKSAQDTLKNNPDIKAMIASLVGQHPAHPPPFFAPDYAALDQVITLKEAESPIMHFTIDGVSHSYKWAKGVLMHFKVSWKGDSMGKMLQWALKHKLMAKKVKIHFANGLEMNLRDYAVKKLTKPVEVVVTTPAQPISKIVFKQAGEIIAEQTLDPPVVLADGDTLKANYEVKLDNAQ